MLIEADPRLADRDETAQICAFTGAQLAGQVQAFRDELEATGQRNWLIQPGSTH